MKIYLASSWRNQHYRSVLAFLRDEGHVVYDFQHPGKSFDWQELDPGFHAETQWSGQLLRQRLDTDLARRGFGADYEALTNCDAVVLCLPAGASAHLEAGFAAGDGSYVFIYMPEPSRPELMYSLADGIATTGHELLALLDRAAAEPRVA